MRFPAIPFLIALMLMITTAVVVPNSLRLAEATQVLVADLMAEGGIEVSFDKAIEDSVRFRVLPRPQVIFTNLSMTSSDKATVQMAAKLPRLIVDLDIAALLQRRLKAKSVHVIEADITAQFDQSPQGFLASLLSVSQPGFYLLDSRVVASGLNASDPSKSMQLPAVSLAMPPRNVGEPLKLTIQHPTGFGELAQFALQLSEQTPATPNSTIDVQAKLRLAVNEKLTFEGSVTRHQNWRLDGELNLSSGHAMAGLMEHYLPVAISQEARLVSFSGLVRGDATGIRSQNLEISALNTLFQSRLALDWPSGSELDSRNGPLLIGRLSTGSLNLDALRAAPKPSSPAPAADQLWRSLAPDLGIGLRLEANQFELGGETGSNLLLAFDWRGDRMNIERLSLNLPFRSALLAEGVLDVSAPTPAFSGSFSTRSSDGLAAMIWASDQFSSDISGFAESIDPSRLQRVGLVGDMDWANGNLQLTRLSGRLDDDRVSGEIAVKGGPALNIEADLNFSRLDMSDWGIADGQTNRDIKLAAIWHPVHRTMESWLQKPDAEREVKLRLKADQLYSGAQSFGPLQLQAQVRNQYFTLDDIQLPDFSGAQISATGQMDYAASLPHGEIDVQLKSSRLKELSAPVLRRLIPISFAADTPVSLFGTLRLSSPEAPDWPDAKFAGYGTIGELGTRFNIITPSRSLDYGVAGSEVSVTLDGSANALAQSFKLPAHYPDTAQGRLEVALARQSADVSALRGELTLSEDKAEVSGRLRPSADGPRLEGALSFTTTDVLPLLGVQSSAPNLPASARGQLNASATNIGFSGFEGQLGDGKMNIDGILQLGGAAPQLAADIILDGSDLTWVLPEWTSTGWAQTPMAWPILGYANADMNLRLLNANFGSVPVNSAMARLKLIEGVLEVPEMSAQFLGGEVSANLQAEGGSLNPYFNLEASFTDVRPPILQTSSARNSLWDAPHGGTLALRGRGTSVAAMMESISGSLQVDAGAGAFTFINVEGITMGLASPNYSGKGKDLVGRYLGAGEVAFESGIGVAQIRNGRVETATADFTLASPRVPAQFKAQVDLVTQEMVAKFELPIAQPGNSILWDISGTIAKLKVELDVSQMKALRRPSAPSLK